MQSIDISYKKDISSAVWNSKFSEILGDNVIIKGFNVIPSTDRSVKITHSVGDESVLYIQGAKIKETSVDFKTLTFEANSTGSVRYDTIYAIYEHGISSECKYEIAKGSSEAPLPLVTCKIATVKIGPNATTIYPGDISLSENRIFSLFRLSKEASAGNSGLLSSTLFTKLTNIEEGANKYSHPTTSGNKHIPSGGSSGKILGWSSDGTAAWVDTPVTYTLPTASSTVLGGVKIGSNIDILNGVISVAAPYSHPTTSGNKHIPSGGSAGKILGWSADGTATWIDTPTTYTHPANHPASIITQDSNNRFVTDAEKTTWNGKANASHGNHVPAYQSANNAVFLRNDGTWVTVTPANIGAAATSHAHNYLPLTGGSITGNLTVSGDITGARVFGAVWNDYAELFEIDNYNNRPQPGDIVELNPETGRYRKTASKNSSLAVGIVSDQFGYLLGGEEGKTIDENLKFYIAVGLAGRVPVKVKGRVKPGDMIVSSDIEGVGMAYNAGTVGYGYFVGKSLETKETDGIEKIQVLII